MPNFREINCPHCGLIVAIPEPHPTEDKGENYGNASKRIRVYHTTGG